MAATDMADSQVRLLGDRQAGKMYIPNTVVPNNSRINGHAPNRVA